MTMHQWLDDGAPITYTLAPSGHTDREGDLTVLDGAHHINPARLNTRPMQQGPKLTNLQTQPQPRRATSTGPRTRMERLMPRDPYRLPLIVDLTPPGWQRRAACVGEDPDLFFPEAKGGRNKGHFLALIDQAQAICDRCPVRAECEKAGRDEGDGIWGGEYRTSTKSTRQMIERIEGGAA